MGLGLVICKNLTEALGGQISVETKVGEGSKFTLTIPSNPNFCLPVEGETKDHGQIQMGTECLYQASIYSMEDLDLDKAMGN